MTQLRFKRTMTDKIQIKEGPKTVLPTKTELLDRSVAAVHKLKTTFSSTARANLFIHPSLCFLLLKLWKYIYDLDDISEQVWAGRRRLRQSAKSQLGAEQHEIMQHDVNAQTERPLQQNKLFNLAANRFASITVRCRIVRGGQRKTLPTPPLYPPPTTSFVEVSHISILEDKQIH